MSTGPGGCGGTTDSRLVDLEGASAMEANLQIQVLSEGKIDPAFTTRIWGTFQHLLHIPTLESHTPTASYTWYVYQAWPSLPIARCMI